MWHLPGERYSLLDGSARFLQQVRGRQGRAVPTRRRVLEHTSAVEQKEQVRRGQPVKQIRPQGGIEVRRGEQLTHGRVRACRFARHQRDARFVTQILGRQLVDLAKLRPKFERIGLTGAGEKSRHRPDCLRLVAAELKRSHRFVARLGPLFLVDQSKRALRMPPPLPGFDLIARRSGAEVAGGNRDHDQEHEHDPAAPPPPFEAQFFGREKEIGIAHVMRVISYLSSGRRSEVTSHRSQVRGHRSEVRGQRAEGRGQRAEVSGQWSVNH